MKHRWRLLFLKIVILAALFLSVGEIIRCHTECCVTMYNEKALNPVQTWLSGFSAMYPYTTFGMAPIITAQTVHVDLS